MKYLRLFEEYLFEASLRDVYRGKVGWILKKENPDSSSASTKERRINKEVRDNLFKVYTIKEDHDDEEVEVDENIPLLYYGTSNGKNSEKFLAEKGVRKENMYNTREAIGQSADKVEFAKTFARNGWVPKTVFDKMDALNGLLDFPLVAKIRGGHSGVGIQKFDSAEELQKSREKFDLFSACIDFEREYRFLFCKDRLVCVNERVPTDGGLDDKGKDKSMDFVYVYQDVSKLPDDLLRQIEKIRRDVRESWDLGVWSLDVVVENGGKVWVIETSSATGLGAIKMTEIYKAIYEDHYKKPLPDFFLQELYKDYISDLHADTWKKHRKEVQSSRYAMDYDVLTGPDVEKAIKEFFTKNK